ncbi:ankyrin repeat domain-containing protein, chloroplastic isoform X1 [Cinnamomum micranthum f. kanehirae]|uniref:Ankyrin repeat domain-containing protein, chloroplastic isoform X1 n=1 Tax=Cinnamomum micranthum f. kanehirae TaxID=337451 RepID=A0A3S3Q0N3_9MAGN|nr:ankyrin repeat domain-containing protein, chloroplastic isoform X1 [Cinnamomum micranthum f. kanehirae]
MSSFAGAVASSSPHSLFHLLPPFSSAARTTCSSSFSLRAPESSSPFFNSGICVSLRSKSTTPRISIWVASKRVPLQTHESNWEYPYDGSDSDYDDDDDEGNKEEREQEFENDFEKDEEEKRIEAGVAAAKYVDTATAPTQYEEELIKEVELLLEPEEKAILEQNEYPVLSKISTTKWSPFHSLALSVQIPFMDKLLQSGFDIDAVDKDGFTALHKAVIGKKEAVISHLLRKGANPHVRNKDGATPLHYAVQVGAIQTVKLLIKYKVDVNVADNEGWTPLHVAVQSRSRDIAKVLLVNGADRTRRNKDGKAPLDLALCFGKDFKSYEVSKLLKLVPANRDL